MAATFLALLVLEVRWPYVLTECMCGEDTLRSLKVRNTVFCKSRVSLRERSEPEVAVPLSSPLPCGSFGYCRTTISESSLASHC